MTAETYQPTFEADVQWSLIPEHMHEGITLYVERGRRPGHFLTAVLTNDLTEAVSRADELNREALVGWVSFLHNYCPANCWGSAEKVSEWIARFDTKRAS